MLTHKYVNGYFKIKSLFFQITLKSKKKTVEVVSLETPLVVEAGLPQPGEEVDSEIESSFKLKPTKKKSVTEESIILERPESVTLQQDQVVTEDRVQEELSQTVSVKTKSVKSVSIKLPDVSEAKTCDIQPEAPRKPSLKSVALETPLVTEEGLISDQQVESEIESTFKLKPGKKKSVSEELVVLERRESVTLQQDQVVTEDRVQEDLSQEVSSSRPLL